MAAQREIRKVLIANRGEIAVRVAKSLRNAGVSVVAVASDIDRDALHVRCADEVVMLGGASAAESYLDVAKVLFAAESTGADAIHPGYGFLAENAEFARACEEAGIVFMGPTPEAMLAMGDKSAAREIAIAAGVPVVPGRKDVADDELNDAAEEIGFPMLLKPSAGGGGKGMRLVHDLDSLADAAAAARREAKASFGDDRLIAERYVKPARHIEIQVFADGEGDVIALGERECSLQRRHQKIIEECPSPVVGEELRQRMCAAAVDLSRKVDYRGAGTVEFLLGPDDSFYFLEMNTRLQVEHPVTEQVYGVDLVSAQLSVARGAGLPKELKSATPRGHAIEVRLYAESPERGFLPAPGPVMRFARPEGPGVRIDSAIDRDGEVSAHYDPMVAKLITTGTDRAEATRRMVTALEDTALLGLETNVALLSEMVGADWFAAGDFSTSSVEELIEEGRLLAPGDDASELPLELLAAAARKIGRGGARKGGAVDGPALGGDPFSPFDDGAAWRGLQGGES